MANVLTTHICLAAGLAVSIAAPLTSGKAQDAGEAHTFHHRPHRVAVSQGGEAPTGLAPLTERRLTIQRRPKGYAPDLGSGDDIYFDGTTRYNSIRTFDPVPYADSGRQFPFGLDGVGGYGSDLGYGAGHDDALYDRGP